jgi:hypothetical protein
LISTSNGGQALDFSQFITTATTIRGSQPIHCAIPGTISVFKRTKHSPGGKHHADDGNVSNHVVANGEQFTDIQAKCQTPKTGQQNAGKVFDMRRRMAQGIDIGIHDVPRGTTDQPNEFEYTKHLFPNQFDLMTIHLNSPVIFVQYDIKTYGHTNQAKYGCFNNF